MQDLFNNSFGKFLGCIYLIKNQKTSSRTKHLAVRHLFGRDLYIENKVIPVFVRSEENISDGLTKNQTQQLFVEHEKVLLNGIMPYRREDVKDTIQTELNSTERRTDDSIKSWSRDSNSGQTDRRGRLRNDQSERPLPVSRGRG